MILESTGAARPGIGPGAHSGKADYDDPAWLGSAVEMSRLRQAAADSGLAIERVANEGSQFCHVLARRNDARA